MAWLKKNIPAVAETKEFLEEMQDALEQVEPVLEALDKDKPLGLSSLTAVTKAKNELNKHGKPLLTHPWKDSKTKKIPLTLKEMDASFKVLSNVVISELDSQKKDAACTKIDKAVSAIEAKLQPKTPADQKKLILGALQPIIKAQSADAFSSAKWTGIWRSARRQYDQTAFTEDNKKDKEATFKLIENAGVALAKQITASEALEKRIANLSKK